jgi:hypothetical protein
VKASCKLVRAICTSSTSMNYFRHKCACSNVCTDVLEVRLLLARISLMHVCGGTSDPGRLPPAGRLWALELSPCPSELPMLQYLNTTTTTNPQCFQGYTHIRLSRVSMMRHRRLNAHLSHVQLTSLWLGHIGRCQPQHPDVRPRKGTIVHACTSCIVRLRQ